MVDAKRGRSPVQRSAPVTLLLLLLLLTTVLYARSLRYSFVSDDYSQIVSNTRIQNWHGLPGFFTEHLWAQQYAAAQGNYYRPLLLIWMVVNYSLFGTNPVGWHATSLLLQLLAGVLLWRTARALTGNDSAALIATAIFLLHPLAVESTVEISDVNDPLCLAFLLASFLVTLNRGHLRPRLATTIAAVVFALALLTKETAIAFVGVMFLYGLLSFRAVAQPPSAGEAQVTAPQRGHPLRTALGVAMPYAATAVLYLIVRRVVLGVTVLHAKPVVSTTTFLLTLPSVAWTYLKHFCVPVKLALFYDTPYVLHPGARAFWGPTLILIAVASLIVLVWKQTRSRPFVFGLSWTVLLLAPSLYGIAFFGNLGLVHDRYFYLPMAGISLSAAVLLAPSLQRKRAALLVAAILATLAVLTFQQQRHWKDNETLFSRAAQVAPRSPTPWLVLAEVAAQKGRIPEAIRLADTGLALDPHYFTGLVLRASLAEKVGDLAQAERAAAAAVALRPDRAEPHALLAQLRFRQARDAEAFAEFNKAVELFPNNLEYRLELARAYLHHNDLPNAIAQYKAALRIAPEEATLAGFIARLEKRPQSRQTTARERERSLPR